MTTSREELEGKLSDAVDALDNAGFNVDEAKSCLDDLNYLINEIEVSFEFTDDELDEVAADVAAAAITAIKRIFANK